MGIIALSSASTPQTAFPVRLGDGKCDPVHSAENEPINMARKRKRNGTQAMRCDAVASIEDNERESSVKESFVCSIKYLVSKIISKIE